MMAYRISLAVFLVMVGISVVFWILAETGYQGRRHRNLTKGIRKETERQWADTDGNTTCSHRDRR